MKRLLFAFTFIMLTTCLATAQDKGAQEKETQPKENEAVFAVVGESIHDFGTIKEADGAVTHTFKIKNEGKAPLVITRVTASCGCTTPEYTKEPIAAGKTGEIKVSFNPTGQQSPFTKNVSVYSNGKTGTSVLTIKGLIEGK